MAFERKDRVKDTTTTTGTGTVTLTGTAPSGYRSVSAAHTDGATVRYAISMGAEWEVGEGIYTASGTTLSRASVLASSNAGALVNFSAGTKDVITTLTANEVDGLVKGPASATANSLARFDGTTGKLLKDGAVIGTDVQAYAGAIMSTPGGRLTLSSATPIMTSDVSNSTSIYYTPYIHDKVPIYNGTNWIITTFTELTNTTTDNTKNPAAVGASSNYDLFVWSDSGTLRLGRGPAWTSDTARGTGAGTTELERVNGIWMNKIAITNGPAAKRGTYVGTIRSNASSTIDWELGGLGAAGDAIVLHVDNAYNAVPIHAESRDSTDSWVYTTAAWRAANNSALMRASFICGLPGKFVSAVYNGMAIAANSWIGVCLDATNTYTGRTGACQITAGIAYAAGAYDGAPGLGSHYLQAVEYGSPTSTFYGDGGAPSYAQNGFAFNGVF